MSRVRIRLRPKIKLKVGFQFNRLEFIAGLLMGLAIGFWETWFLWLVLS